MKGIKKLGIVLSLLLLLATPTYAGNWDINIFGFKPEIITKENWGWFLLGSASATFVHVSGHYIIAGINDTSVHQEGLLEIINCGYSNREYREFAQGGFIFELATGTILTSIPSIKNSGFVKGFVSTTFARVVTYPIVYRNSGDLHLSNKYGGNADLEYIFYLGVASFNLYRIDWQKKEEKLQKEGEL